MPVDLKQAPDALNPAILLSECENKQGAGKFLIQFFVKRKEGGIAEHIVFLVNGIIEVQGSRKSRVVAVTNGPAQHPSCFSKRGCSRALHSYAE